MIFVFDSLTLGHVLQVWICFHEFPQAGSRFKRALWWDTWKRPSLEFLSWTVVLTIVLVCISVLFKVHSPIILWMLMTFLFLQIIAGWNGTSWSAIIACTVINGRVGGWADGRVGVILLYRHLVSQNPRTRPCICSISACSQWEEGRGSRWDISPCMWEHFISPLWSVNLGSIPRRLAASRYQYVAWQRDTNRVFGMRL